MYDQKVMVIKVVKAVVTIILGVPVVPILQFLLLLPFWYQVYRFDFIFVLISFLVDF